MRKSVVLLASVAALALTFSACGKKETSDNEAEQTSTAVVEEETEEKKEVEKAEETEIAVEEEKEAGTRENPLQVMENIRYYGNYTEGEIWLAFTTKDTENIQYRFSLENLSAGSKKLSSFLYDEDENYVVPDSRNYYAERLAQRSDEFLAARADESGTIATGTFESLKPGTTYYLCITGKEPVDYSLKIWNSSEGSDENISDFELLSEDAQELLLGEKYSPGSSQSNSIHVPLGTKVLGAYENGNAWLSFTTTEEDSEYTVTAVNCTTDSEKLSTFLYDEFGDAVVPDKRNYYAERLAQRSDEFLAARADKSGRAATGYFYNLKPNTEYYLQVNGKSAADYSIVVNAAGLKSDAWRTSTVLEESKALLSEDEEFYTGTNQTNATMIKRNVRYYGDYQDGYGWVAFTTDGVTDSPYCITMENLTPGSKKISSFLCDVYGNYIIPESRDYYAERLAQRSDEYLAARADESGTPAVGTFESLEPNTTYYLQIVGESAADYVLYIGSPESENMENEISEEVFEIPFELNETQIRFKAESDSFIEPERAREALAPIAEIILAHPNRAILLAGTTATDGEQEKRVELSDKRAAAVKKVLVEDYGVPEEQLFTVGLGFEADPFERGKDRDANGKFVETEGTKNRRVVVLDAESDMAKQILGY